MTSSGALTANGKIQSLMQLTIAMYFGDKFNRSLMKVDGFFIRYKFPVYAIELQIPKYYSSVSSRINKGKKCNHW